MDAIVQARTLIKQALYNGESFASFAELVQLKEDIARLETELAWGHEPPELIDAGMSRSEAKKVLRRASFTWNPLVPVEHQDLILSALEYLSGRSTRRDDIYNQATDAALVSSARQTHEYTKKLVREENEALAKDPFEAHRQRYFRLHKQDEHGGCTFSGYAPAADAALLQALLDQAFGRGTAEKDDLRTVAQRSADAFGQILRWASSNRVESTGHASLIISTTDEAEFAWQAKFATNTGVDLSLFDIDMLGADRLTDYIVVHDHRGAVKTLVTGQRHANFSIRVGLMARDLVCQHPGCDVHAGQCDAHHAIPWSRGGPTALDNMALLCKNHHARNDDTHRKRHLKIFEGTPWWVSDDGGLSQNDSPAAQRSGRWRTRKDRAPT